MSSASSISYCLQTVQREKNEFDEKLQANVFCSEPYNPGTGHVRNLHD